MRPVGIELLRLIAVLFDAILVFDDVDNMAGIKLEDEIEFVAIFVVADGVNNDGLIKYY